MKTPVLRGTLLIGPKTTQLQVFCPYCDERHVHGWEFGRTAKHLEHRVAHCSNKNSPFLAEGYYIGLTPKGWL